MFRFDAAVLDPPSRQDRAQRPIALPVPVGRAFQFSASPAVTALVHARSPWQPLPHQLPPAGEAWDCWLTIAGRGSGKTRGAAEYVLQHLRAEGARARVGIGAPDLASARDVCAEGESGLITIAPGEFQFYHRSIGYCEARHKAGGYVRFMGSESPSRWNGPQWSLLWWDEWALVNRDSYRESQLGLRLGAWPHTVITTTPKRPALKAIRELAARPGVVTYTARTADNPYLPDRRKAELERDYGGTTLGRMELGGELVEQADGALWKAAWIDDNRATTVPDLTRTVVAVDPAVTATGDETGIVVAGTVGEQVYVLADYSCQGSPDHWAQRAIAAFDDFQADRIVAEVNNGGELVERVLRTVRAAVPYAAVHASRGKAVRAEPVAALYEQKRVHHAGVFGDLEDQLLSWEPGQRESPDRLDALVWAVSQLVLERKARLRAL